MDNIIREEGWDFGSNRDGLSACSKILLNPAILPTHQPAVYQLRLPREHLTLYAHVPCAYPNRVCACTEHGLVPIRVSLIISQANYISALSHHPLQAQRRSCQPSCNTTNNNEEISNHSRTAISLAQGGRCLRWYFYFQSLSDYLFSLFQTIDSTFNMLLERNQPESGAEYKNLQDHFIVVTDDWWKLLLHRFRRQALSSWS